MTKENINPFDFASVFDFDHDFDKLIVGISNSRCVYRNHPLDLIILMLKLKFLGDLSEKFLVLFHFRSQNFLF